MLYESAPRYFVRWLCLGFFGHFTCRYPVSRVTCTLTLTQAEQRILTFPLMRMSSWFCWPLRMKDPSIRGFLCSHFYSRSSRLLAIHVHMPTFIHHSEHQIYSSHNKLLSCMVVHKIGSENRGSWILIGAPSTFDTQQVIYQNSPHMGVGGISTRKRKRRS